MFSVPRIVSLAEQLPYLMPALRLTVAETPFETGHEKKALAARAARA
jgi:hypothetical protein